MIIIEIVRGMLFRIVLSFTEMMVLVDSLGTFYFFVKPLFAQLLFLSGLVPRLLFEASTITLTSFLTYFIKTYIFDEKELELAVDLFASVLIDSSFFLFRTFLMQKSFS